MKETSPQMSRAWLVFWLIVPLAILDQLTKIAAIRWLKGTPMQSYLGDIFRFQYAENPGAFLSMGSGMSEETRFWVFSVAVAAFLIACIVYLLRTPGLDRFSVFGLSLISSGGLSNLIDRLFRPGGRVIDFMNMGIGTPWGDVRTGIFNIADMAIIAGVALMIVSSLRATEQGTEEPK